MKNRLENQALKTAESKESLYAKYLLGQLSVQELAYKLRSLNNVQAHYEIDRAKRNTLNLAYFKDVTTNKPGEQLNPTLSDLQPVRNLKEAEQHLKVETCPEKQRELKTTLHKKQQQIEQQKIVITINNLVVLKDNLRKAQVALKQVRTVIRKGLKVALKGAKAFSNLGKDRLSMKQIFKGLLSSLKRNIRSRNLGQNMVQNGSKR